MEDKIYKSINYLMNYRDELEKIGQDELTVLFKYLINNDQTNINHFLKINAVNIPNVQNKFKYQFVNDKPVFNKTKTLINNLVASEEFKELEKSIFIGIRKELKLKNDKYGNNHVIEKDRDKDFGRIDPWNASPDLDMFLNELYNNPDRNYQDYVGGIPQHYYDLLNEIRYMIFIDIFRIVRDNINSIGREPEVKNTYTNKPSHKLKIRYISEITHYVYFKYKKAGLIQEFKSLYGRSWRREMAKEIQEGIIGNSTDNLSDFYVELNKHYEYKSNINLKSIIKYLEYTHLFALAPQIKTTKLSESEMEILKKRIKLLREFSTCLDNELPIKSYLDKWDDQIYVHSNEWNEIYKDLET